ncbi:thioether cross-link-forming SCIFF peptide maturase [Alkalibaculum sp. M08DMB]|uniref:Thioether cross-link-forming SCIFF peptide maturase n=1 Tax=Alkalibaculum sporogenes TaxID=2655001 RepID=A0A6A7K599_9FIRM|nr:thioether cross-link-forming SCIFF peptide maturase [Alkalibaculum sporogenes]MPW24560.1 thioether cross-link-forming SCIFF peptide maturase [Alkalibaculum sporogenes]
MIHKYKLNDKFILLDINSGGVFKIDEITYDILDHYPEKDRNTVTKLLQSKYKVLDIGQSIDEIDTLISSDELFSEQESITYDFKNNTSIKAMCLHVSHDCNIRCKYCFASQGNFQGEKLLMDEETGKAAIDFLIYNSIGRRNLEIDFFGGEPLLNFALIKKLVNYARDKEVQHNKNFRFTITTNALLLNDENIEYINDNMDNVVLSIDGRKETNDNMRYTINNQGTYDIIIDNLKNLVNKRGDKDYYLRGTFTKFNLDFSNDVLHLADCGFDKISVEPVVAKPDMDYALCKEDLPKLFDEYEKLSIQYLKRKKDNPFNFFHFNIDLDHGPCLYKRVSGCGAGNDYIAITPLGDIYPCHQFVGDEKFKLGSLETGIINKDIKDQFYKANLVEKTKCTDCWAKYYCGGGCLANAYNTNLDILSPDEVGCELEKKRLECAIMIQTEQ